MLMSQKQIRQAHHRASSTMANVQQRLGKQHVKMIMNPECSVICHYQCATRCRLDCQFRLGYSTVQNIKPPLHHIKGLCARTIISSSSLVQSICRDQEFACRGNKIIISASQCTFEPVNFFPILDSVVRHVQNLRGTIKTCKLSQNQGFEAAAASVQSGTKVMYPQHSCLFDSDELLNVVVRHPQLLQRVQDVLQTLKYLRQQLFCSLICNNEATITRHLDLVSCKGPAQSVNP